MLSQTPAKQVKRSTEAIVGDIYLRAKRIPFPWDEAAPNNFDMVREIFESKKRR